MARLAGDSEATEPARLFDIWAAASGALGPATIAVANAADTCFLRAFSLLALGARARRYLDRSSERCQTSAEARSLWTVLIRHVPFRSGLRG
jgi:hypothetical protein